MKQLVVKYTDSNGNEQIGLIHPLAGEFLAVDYGWDDYTAESAIEFDDEVLLSCELTSGNLDALVNVLNAAADVMKYPCYHSVHVLENAFEKFINKDYDA